VLGTVLGDVITSLSFRHRPMVCDCQMSGQGFLSGAALSHHTTASGDAFLRAGAKPPSLDI
jgi:hypothetical protein